MTRPEIADELGLSLPETEALLKYIRKREDIPASVGRRDYFLRDAIARYVEAGDVSERVMLAISAASS
jgi:hypothetical protein